LILWLADQLYDVVKDEQLGHEAIKIAEKYINHRRISSK